VASVLWLVFSISQEICQNNGESSHSGVLNTAMANKIECGFHHARNKQRQTLSVSLKLPEDPSLEPFFLPSFIEGHEASGKIYYLELHKFLKVLNSTFR
jgi:hypothetical protein